MEVGTCTISTKNEVNFCAEKPKNANEESMSFKYMSEAHTLSRKLQEQDSLHSHMLDYHPAARKGAFSCESWW
jgi:hypothetical protein